MEERKVKATRGPKKVVNTQLVVATPSTSEIIGILNKRLDSLKHVSDTMYKTGSAIVDGFPDIKKQTCIEDLVKVHSYIKAKNERYIDSQQILDVVCGPFKQNGYTYEEWTADIVLRIQIIQHKDTITKIEKAKAKIEQFLTAEEKKIAAINEVSDLIGIDITTMLAGEVE